MEPEEPVPAEAFAARITADVDDWFFHRTDYADIWLKKYAWDDPEAVQAAIVRRLRIGYLNELYIRDAAILMMKAAPSLRAQRAFLQQVEDEHTHAQLLAGLMARRGIDADDAELTRAWSMFWSYIHGHAARQENFLNAVATLQLVEERSTGLHAMMSFVEKIADVDPELADLYGGRIRKDEIFHTVDLPRLVLEQFATTVEAQRAVLDGVERAKMMIGFIADELR